MITERIYSSEFKIENFGDGEWQNEPDYAEFEYNGIACKIIRMELGYLCGYCYLPKDHPWIGLDISEINSKTTVEIHGGITYSEDDKIGFDCAHSEDLFPSIEKIKSKQKRINDELDLSMISFKKRFANFFERTYRNFDFVVNECKTLADQIIKAKKFKVN